MSAVRAITITNVLHSRGFALLLALAVTVALTVYYHTDTIITLSGDRGLVLPSANLWVVPGPLNFWLAMLAGGIVVLFMVLLNKFYNILRSMTSLYISFFALMQLATPSLTVQLCTGPILALAATGSMMLLFGHYSSPMASRHVFLVFAIFSFLSATQYCYALYVPVLVFWLWQMRILNGRTLVAAFLGLVTPWWLLFGFGIITPAQVHLPRFESVLLYNLSDALLMFVTVVFTGLLLVTVLLLNIFKTIAYNARSRALNSSLTGVALFTLVAMMADYGNAAAYIPLLNVCAALQAAHYFSAHKAEKSYIAIAAVMGVYIVLYLCQTVI